MARPLRVEYPGAFYHVMNRANGRESIFIDQRDREKFLQYLEIATERFGPIVHTYCLMDNHYHLLLETPQPNLSVTMHWLNVSYATYFNRKRQRHGHLFQGRFKAILIDADTYLKQLSRYIHLNPVRAEMAIDPGQYSWSSYPAFIGKEEPAEFLETGWLLASFGKSKKAAQKNYRQFVEDVDIKSLKNPSKQVRGGFILGDTDFVKWVKDTLLAGRMDEGEIPQLKKLKPRIAPEMVVGQVAASFDCDPKKILAKGLKNNRAREVAIYLTRDLCGLSCKELGAFFGGVGGALITIMYNRMAEETARSMRLRRKVENIQKRILNI